MYKHEGGNALVINFDIFDETYIPSNILARSSQIRELQLCISPGLRNQRPIHAWLHGVPGTGKTMTAKYIISKLNEDSRMGGVYVNCWKSNSYYSVLDTMLNELRIGFGDERDSRLKLYKFESFIGTKPFVVVLDEIDMMPVKERNSTVYNILGMRKVGLICISESRHSVMGMEDRIKSRLNPRFVHFEPYSAGDLAEILKERVIIALHPETWDESILSRIAALSNGDARLAIQTLKNAVQFAEDNSRKTIDKDYVDKAFRNMKDLNAKYTIAKLPEDHRILYEIVKQKGRILSGQLWNAYLKECVKSGMTPIARRTFSHYMEKLKMLNLIRVERARTKGKVHSFSLAD